MTNLLLNAHAFRHSLIFRTLKKECPGQAISSVTTTPSEKGCSHKSKQAARKK